MIETFIKLFLCHYFSGLNSVIYCYCTNQDFSIFLNSYTSYNIYTVSFLFYIFLLF